MAIKCRVGPKCRVGRVSGNTVVFRTNLESSVNDLYTRARIANRDSQSLMFVMSSGHFLICLLQNNVKINFTYC